MRKVTRAKRALLSFGLVALALAGTQTGLAADASAPESSAPAGAPNGVTAAMALGAKATQQLQEEKKKQAEEERLKGFGADWESWEPDNTVSDVASLERGMRDFMGYCRACHSLKYMRYSRLGADLQMTPEQLQKYVLPPGAKPGDYISAPMPLDDAQTWFGKQPPDLSLMARARGPGYLYRLWTTYYVDPSKATGANNLQLPNVAMPHVLATLEGPKAAVFRTVDTPGPGGTTIKEQVFDHFVQLQPGSLSHEEYLATVRDLVNFLDYAGEPAQVQRRSLGVKVVLFLLAFTALTYLLKREYWKNVH
jgi:ubiquinol-cytochrome c reductase cytochrome c1 subunit